MPNNDEDMTLAERRKYFKRMQGRYWAADRAGRGRRPERLRELGAKFRQASDQSELLVQQLASAVNGLQERWRGMSAQSFYGDYQSWQTSMRGYVGMLSQIGHNLDAIAVEYERGDHDAGKALMLPPRAAPPVARGQISGLTGSALTGTHLGRMLLPRGSRPHYRVQDDASQKL